jgi:hypothetical protein
MRITATEVSVLERQAHTGVQILHSPLAFSLLGGEVIFLFCGLLTWHGERDRATRGGK